MKVLGLSQVLQGILINEQLTKKQTLPKELSSPEELCQYFLAVPSTPQ